MAEENKHDDFEDSFDSEEFNFLEEDEIKAEPNAAATTNNAVKKPASSGLPIKQFLVVGGMVLTGMFLFNVFNVMHKKPQKSTELANTTTAPKIAKKNDQTVTIQVKPNPEGSLNKDSNAVVTDSKNSSTPVQAVNSVNQAAGNTTDPELIKIINTPGEEKSREEMADLFATSSIEQTNLAAVVAQQAKEVASNQQNSDLFKKDKTDSKNAKEIENAKVTTQLQHTVESITQEITENVNHIKQLEDKLNEFTKLLAKVNQNIGAIDSRLLGLTESVDSLTQDVSNVKKVIAEEDLDLASNTTKLATETQFTYKPPGYSIHAIIPGRAWLKTSSGQIITVAEGDGVGDYGTVAVIDAANNIVKTSSGVTFR